MRNRKANLPESAGSATLAAYVCAVVHGIAVQAKAGFSREMLEAVVAQALSTWPEGNQSAAPGTPA